MSEVEGRIALAASDETGVVTSDPPTKFEIERGVGFQLPFATPFEGYQQVLKRDPITSRQMMSMLDTDGQARALFRLISLPIRAALKNASFIPAEDGEEEAEFMSQMFTLPPASGGMVTTFDRVMEQILLGVFNGFSAFEQVYWMPSTGPLKDKYTLKKLAHRPSDSVTFLTDEDGHYEGFRQYAIFNSELRDVRIPKEDSFYYAANEAERPFYGKSYFLSAFYHYDMKVRLYYIQNLAAQRSAVGFRVGKYPGNPTKAEKRDFETALANLGAFGYMSMPQGWEVDSLKEGGNFDFAAVINHHNSQMSKSVLAGFMDDNQGTSASTTPMVDFGQKTNEFFVLMLRTIMNDIAAQINHYIIPKFIKWNYDSGKYPRFQWGAFTDEQLEAIRYTFMDLALGGDVNATPEFVRAAEVKTNTMLGLGVDYKAVEAREAEDKIKAEALIAQQQQQFGQQGQQFGQQGQQQQGGNPPPANPQFSDRQQRQPQSTNRPRQPGENPGNRNNNS